MRTVYDVIVIGAGVAGAAIARELSRYMLDVAVLEKEVDVSFGTSKANSGIIHAGFHADPTTLKGRLCAKANRMYDRLQEELDFPFERRGELMVAFSEEEVRTLSHFYEQGQRNGVRYMELLGRERTLELEPNLNPDVEGALFAPTAGVIGPYEFCFAMIDNAKENGVEVHCGQKVCWIGKQIGHMFEIETETGERFRTHFIVNAAGLYADDIASLVGLQDFKIKPRKGEEYLLDRRVGELVHRVIFPVPSGKSKGMLIIPTVDGPVMVGPTAVEIDDKTDFSTTRDGLKQVFSHAQHMLPAIRASDAITSFVGLRPAATGEDFFVGATTIPGFLNAAGIQSPGLTASPLIAECVRDELLAQGLRMEVRAQFNPHRKKHVQHIRPSFEKRDYDAVEKMIERNPAYSRLVCRCECVTEAEIVDAIKSGHTTMDGIKFATRAGTGRCQAGFCTARVMEILHRETGIPLEKISKKGPGTEVAPIPMNKGKGGEA